MIRLLFSLIYISLGIWVYFRLGGDNLHPFVFYGVFLALIFSSTIVCNEGFLRKLKGKSDQEHIDDMLDKKLALKENYSSKTAITFEDLSTSCLCHIIETQSDNSICLYGQYLYDFVEIVDDPELNQTRQFPTSDFTLIRKVKDKSILDLEIGSNVIEEIRIENPNIGKLRELGIKLADGELINNISFERILKAVE